jgi:NTP pyrophosphatase (non-canonical NTP hydrolase)
MMKGEETKVVSLRRDPASGAEPPSLEAIATRLRKFRAERNWERFHTPRSLAVSVAIEAGELLEQFQWVSDEEVANHVEKRRDSIQEELADVAIYLVQLSDVLGISLAEAIEGKISLNESRYPAAAARGSSRKYTELTGDDPLITSGG